MKFGELKQVVNRCSGRHDKIAITIGLGTDAIIEAESEILDYLDDYEVAWIAAKRRSKQMDFIERCNSDIRGHRI